MKRLILLIIMSTLIPHQSSAQFNFWHLMLAQELTWPFGKLNDLVVNAGETKTISAGSSYDYQNVTIKAGGVLNIVGDGVALLGVRGTLTIDGTITSNNNLNTGSYSVYDPFLKSNINLSRSQSYGGDGGFGGAAPSGHGGGAPGTNNYTGIGGGGGGGGGRGNQGYADGPGGIGGANGAAGYKQTADLDVDSGSGGPGNYTLSHGSNGSNTGNKFGGTGGTGGGSGGGPGGGGSFGGGIGGCGGGGGGGGGYKGSHKNSLVIRIKGPMLGSGYIDLRGTSGYNGGAGAAGSAGCGGQGGGGGGGAGGSGGHVYIYYKITPTFSFSNILNTGGPGGSAGAGANNGGAGGTGANGARIFLPY